MPHPLSSAILASTIALFPIPVLSADLTPPALTCSNGMQVKDELYFGLSKSQGGRVSDLEWQLFLQKTVTPRFRDGLTVVNATGQYLTQSGQLTIEFSKLVILVHLNTPDKARAIAEIITQYKTQFQQESVLRVTTCAQVTF